MVSNPTKDLAWPFAEKALRLFLGTALTLLIARQIGPSEFGTFSSVFASYMLFSALAGLGLKDIVIDEIASGRTSPRIVLSTASTMVFAASLILSVAFIALINLIYPGYGTEFWVSFLLSATLFLKGFEVLLIGLEAHAELRSISLSQQISIIVGAISKSAILLIGATVISFTAAITLEFLALYATTMVFASQSSYVLSLRAFRFKHAIAILKRSWPLAASSLAVIGYFYVDQLTIAMLMDIQAVGIYAAASRISQQLYVLPTVLVAAYYARLTHVHAQSPTTFDEGFKALAIVLITLAITLWGVIFLLSESLLGLILGSQFEEAAAILKLHALGLVFVSLSVISDRWYVMQGLQKLILARQFLTAALNVLLNLLMIPLFGLDGAVYATLVSLFFLAFGFDLLSTQTSTLASMKFSTLACLAQPQAISRAFRDLASL